MIWKVYFWAYVILSLMGVYGYLNRLLTMADILGIFTALFIGMGVYSFAYSKQFFSKQVWAIGFYFVVIAFGLEVIYRLTDMEILSGFLISKYIIGIADLAVTSVLIIPALFALYILSGHQIQKPSKSKRPKK